MLILRGDELCVPQPAFGLRWDRVVQSVRHQNRDFSPTPSRRTTTKKSGGSETKWDLKRALRVDVDGVSSGPMQKPRVVRGSERLTTQLSELEDLVLAEREGFEPSVVLPLRLISSQVHSTTLPPLLGRCRSADSIRALRAFEAPQQGHFEAP